MNVKTANANVEQKPELQHHFFASTFCSWATAPTRAEAIAKAAKIAGGDMIKRAVKNSEDKGMYCWTCRVDLPQSTDYWIESYAPAYLYDDKKEVDRTKRVVCRDAQTFAIVSAAGHVIPMEKKETSEKEQLRLNLRNARSILHGIDAQASERFAQLCGLDTEWEESVTEAFIKLVKGEL